MKKNNKSHALIGRCGLYCGACDIYRVYSDKKKEKQRRMAQFFKCKPEQVRCQGCQNLTPADWCSECKILACLDRLSFHYCYECDKIESCDVYQELNGRYNNLPYENLMRLKACGEEKWLNEQKERWSCPQCGTPLDYEAKRCPHCNSDRTTKDLPRQ